MSITSITKTAGAAGVALLSAMAPAFASDITPPPAEREFTYSVTLGGTSDYIFRGLSLYNEDPAFQPSINFGYGIFYAGLWGSNVADPAGPWETDIYAGIKPVLGPLTFDFGALWYTYPASDKDLNYVELKAGVSYSPITNLTFTPVFWWVPDQTNADEQVTIEGTLAYTLPDVKLPLIKRTATPTISGLVGYTEATDSPGFYKADGTDSYTYWNAGLSLTVDKLTLDFRYWDTDLDSAVGDGYYGLDDSRFVFSTSITLP